jgi:putative Mg2+ transporter-C (MgtC) family protein
MESLIAEFGHPTHVPFPVICFRLGLAILLGGAIGFEREVQNRPAGLRTHILTCVAAAMIAILTVEITHSEIFKAEGVHFDPIRAVEAVTAGIAFLAAGTILFAKGEVHGLTTGAGMWLAGAIGLCCGLGLWQVATFGTVLALAVLYIVRRLEDRLGSDKPLVKASSDKKAAGKSVKKD